TTAAIANLNARRDELPELVGARVVLWVSEIGGRSLNEQARDLVEVVLTTAEFNELAKVPMAPRGVKFDTSRWTASLTEPDRAGIEAQAERLAELAIADPHAWSAASMASAAASLYAVAARYEAASDWAIQAAKWRERCHPPS